MPPLQCISIKSKKYPNLRCPNSASRGEYCAKHVKSKTPWKPHTTISFTQAQLSAAKKIHSFWKFIGRPRLRTRLGPALFSLSESHNDKDIYTYDPISSIPLTFHFSYADSEKRLWTFDLRFLIHLLQYGNEFRNPFTQDLFPPKITERLQQRSEFLRRRGVPILYADETIGLTPEQLWNQKVLDVFLRLTSLGFGVNVLWFESMTGRQHQTFYTSLFEQWNYGTPLTHAEKERLVPGHASARTPLFRWFPQTLESEFHDVKWWRKQSLALMNAFLTRGQDRDTQGCGAIYILTAMARSHPRAAESFPWLV